MKRIALAIAVLLAPATAIAAPCDVQGIVVDPEGNPVVGIDVRLEDGAAPRHTKTDERGAFRFATVAKPTAVVATLRDAGQDPRFTLVEADAPIELRTKVDPSGDCTVSLGAADGPPEAAARLALYQGLRRGFDLIDRLGISSRTPLTVVVADPIASADAAYWVGTSSFNPEDTVPARIVLGRDASSALDLGAPDNREYHEVGHHALALAFGALPRSRDNLDDGGYHRNPSSTRAWTEGFAIFFAAMVAREIEQRPDAGLYRVAGGTLDLELDYRPWDLAGLESVAVAGLLWDLVDGDAPALGSPLKVDNLALREDPKAGHLLIGRVHNPSSETATRPRVQVETPQWRGSAPVAAARLEPDAEAWFAMPLPTAVATLDDPLAAIEARATPRPAHSDDDPVQLKLDELWPAITQLRSERPESNGRLHDVSDLHHALRGRFGGKDRDGDGVDDIDQLFIAHGLFADLDGNRAHDAGEAVGLTSHPGAKVTVDGTSTARPDLIPRHRLSLPASLTARLEVEPSDAAIVVVDSMSSWGGYLTPPSRDGVVLIPPPAIERSSVSVIAIAPEREPTVLLHFEASALLNELERNTTPFLSATATLPAFKGDRTSVAGSPQWPQWTFIGGAIAMVLGLLFVAIGWPRPR
ncbi:MAG: carboxypeptidase-like regulatory domain-containing protein [Myxococcota bacterium]